MTDEQSKCLEHLRSFSNAMLTTMSSEQNDQLRARPMHIAKVEDDGCIYFLTKGDSSKVDDVLETRQSLVTMQAKTAFISASGTCRVRNDVKMDELWGKGSDLWFENGKEDAVVLEFRPITVEVWNQELLGLKFVFEAARAAVTGETIRPGKAGEHLHTTMP